MTPFDTISARRRTCLAALPIGAALAQAGRIRDESAMFGAIIRERGILLGA